MFFHGAEKGSELLKCEELLLTWFPLSAPSRVLFMASCSSIRTVHRSLMCLVCDVELCRGKEYQRAAERETLGGSVWRRVHTSKKQKGDKSENGRIEFWSIEGATTKHMTWVLAERGSREEPGKLGMKEVFKLQSCRRASTELPRGATSVTPHGAEYYWLL
jgi:hypothetical protein